MSFREEGTMSSAACRIDKLLILTNHSISITDRQLGVKVRFGATPENSRCLSAADLP